LIVEDRAWKSNLPQAFINAGLELGYPYVDINGNNQTGEIFLLIFILYEIILPLHSCKLN
jgi:hypothetical protein